MLMQGQYQLVQTPVRSLVRDPRPPCAHRFKEIKRDLGWQGLKSFGERVAPEATPSVLPVGHSVMQLVSCGVK